MKNKLVKLVMLGTALSMTAACGRRAPAPDQIPPAPRTDAFDPNQQTGQPGTGIGTAPLPGSRADFLQNVRSDRVFFAFDSYSLDAEARGVLDQQAQWLTRNPNVRVTIEGHADERGTREYNLALGDRRANAARNYLESRGIAASRIQTISWGKERPEALGSNESAWAQNRRAVTVVPE
ncbi:MAG: peptidoglycan-associated lipoprotein Pal [Allosphingosinicella sp.]|uniref:peptidoglycan-associated lipoprotein Pal n=1 Tax=Allosphingosinicella sp. TaxID=2823234 RepID=UPI00394885C1